MKRLLLVVMLVMIASAARAEPLAIRVGWSTMPGHMIPVLFTRPDILRHYGKTYTVEPVAFRGSSPQLTALAAREIDLIASSPGTLALAVLNARLDVKVVADIIQDGVPGYHTETFIARADSGLTGPRDLKGKRIASNAIGSASDTAMRAVMAKAGLQDRRDFVTIQAAFPSMLALLDEKKVDAAPILMPQLASVRADPKYRVLFTARDGLGQSDLVFLIASSAFLEKNRPAVQDFIEDYVRAIRWFAEPSHRTEALAIIGGFMKVPPAELSYLFTTADYYRDPFSRPNVEALQSAIDITHSVGIIPGTIPVAAKHADLSFIDEATRRIQQSP